MRVLNKCKRVIILKCQLCGKEVDLPFRCSHCNGYFCMEHRLPENHQCPNRPEELLWRKEQEIVEAESNQKTKRIKEGKLYFVKEEPTPEPQKPKRKSKLLVATSLVLIISVALAAFTSYNVGYNDGYNVGYGEGNSLGYDSGYEDGYVQGVTDGAGRGFNIRDPTYQEALQFIASDQTDKNAYNEKTYNCHDFTADFKNNAFSAGFRCGYVYIEFREGAHAIASFDTINHGLIFIEPQDDEIITLTVGQQYWDRNKYIPIYDDTIVRFTIIW